MRKYLLFLILAGACRERPTAPAVIDTVPACLERGNSRNKLRVVQCPDTAPRR